MAEDSFFGEPDYAAGPPVEVDEFGVRLAMHVDDGEGMCLWCRLPHPCPRLRKATASIGE